MMSDHPPIGTCTTFCPDVEREKRTRMKLLHVLEQGKAHQCGDVVHVVKEYIRAGAGCEVPPACQLRPAPVLMDTMLYLIRLLDYSRQPFHVVYEFVTNRIQSIRQDITFQQLDDPIVTEIYEIAARFHIYAQYRLWNSPVKMLDPKLNSDNLHQCLVKVVKSECMSFRAREEFEAYYVLCSFGHTDVLARALSLLANSSGQTLLRLCVEIGVSFMMNNFVRCCRLIQQLPPLHQAAVWPHVHLVHRTALRTMCTAYSCSSGSFPMRTLMEWLKISQHQEASELCQSHGIPFEENKILFRKNVFKEPEQVFRVPPHISRLLEDQCSDWILKSKCILSSSD